MSNTEIKNLREIAEKTKNLPIELQQRLCDTANGMVMAAEAYRAAESQTRQSEKTCTA